MYKAQRLHPAAILEFIFRNLYKLAQALLPLIILALGESAFRSWFLTFLPIVLVLFIVYMIFYWLRFVFYVQDNELRLEYGVLVRKKRYISFERIQTVQVSAGVIQRILGLVKLQIETAGGGNKAELILPAISADKAAELQKILQKGKVFNPDVPDKDRLIQYRLSSSDLLILGSTSNSLGLILAGMLTIVSQLDKIIPNLKIWEVLGKYASNLMAGTVYITILVIIFIILLACLLSLLGNLIKFAGFTLIRDGDNLKISRGLFEKKQLSIPVKRIQALKIVEGILRQPFKMVSIQVVSISNVGDKGEGNVIMPVIPRHKMMDFLEEVLPEFYRPFEVEMLPNRSKMRYILINFIPATVLVIIIFLFLPFAYPGLILLPLAIWLGSLQYRDTGYSLQESMLIIRSRILGKVSTIVPRRKIQSLSISRNYFQVRKNLNTLRVSIASGVVPANVKLVGMDDEKSSVIIQWFSR